MVMSQSYALCLHFATVFISTRNIGEEIGDFD
jgi:hypothetical protein